jgi:hypothetical protein
MHAVRIYCDGSYGDTSGETGIIGVGRFLPGANTLAIRTPVAGYARCDVRVATLRSNDATVAVDLPCFGPTA